MLFGALCLILAAQDAGPVAGLVTSSLGHKGIGGVAVTAGALHTTTDSSGAFGLAGLPPGEHRFTFEAPGFFRHETRLRLDAGITAAPLNVELTPHSSISGRVVDAEGKALAGVQVEITQAIRGTGSTWNVWGAVTDKEGRYRAIGLGPGTYLAMARPDRDTSEEEKHAAVRTYYPSAPDRSQAGRLILRGGTDVAADIRVKTVPVYSIRGMIYDDEGRPANGLVSLESTEVLEGPTAKANMRDGAFEFPKVPAGDWRVIAEAEVAGRTLRGATATVVNRHDVENIAIRLAAPFALAVIVEPSGAPTIELYPVDAPRSQAAFAKANGDGKLEFPAVYPGRYSVNVFGTPKEHYLDAVMVGEQDVLGRERVFAEGMAPLRVVFKPNAAGVRGAVENCGGASVLLLPQDEGLWSYPFIQQRSCDRTGHFTIGGLRPGSYYAVAVDRIDGTGLDDLGTLRRLASMAERIQVESGRVGYVELKVQRWPE
uniref:Carboxypeptidase regulatory-like domain-containing protein n=1 Tax=Solibacter usitatus (strain Ellin6076) TaxID=234267 RepID=Q01Z66_SOLUE